MTSATTATNSRRSVAALVACALGLPGAAALAGAASLQPRGHVARGAGPDVPRFRS